MIRQLSLILSFFIISATSFAQNWGGGIDDEDWSFGFNFQYISAEYKILKKPNWRSPFYEVPNTLDPSYDPNSGIPITSNLNAISSQPSQGFGLGFVMNRMISDNFDIRATPSLIFSDRVVTYEYEPMEPINVGNGQTKNFQTLVDRKVQATMFEFPLGIKVKSNRLNNFRVYWLGGAKYSIDIASKKKTFDEGETAVNKFLKNKRNYLSYETGIGFDIYFEYFKMSPEIKLSYSASDLLQHDNTIYANPIDKLKLRQLTFSLIFQ
ncbi:Outer membrane protein beta-barrel domain-containing protein [Pedobacter terrae]|uniref:Outer membrane protein beta-barrel domain-containing protein n=1 Tax=Pedobacter terrae TaxID=405671 RepID=A0A1G7YDX9_9SPHI|nr:outer membrane beta-barrel protein [Pedobacter terrae]SDG94768.1 Outer membrane protein beta-barrel domain-containing protein [Pedobacter terrae]